MMRKILQRILRQPLTTLANRFASAPRKEQVQLALDQLRVRLQQTSASAGPTIPFALESGKFIIFSDQHKGIRDNADDFRNAAPNFLQALHYYYDAGYTLINNGDAEELWENKPSQILDQNTEVLAAEARFLKARRYYRIFGNHDLEWKYDWPRRLYLVPVFGRELKVTEAVVLQTQYGEAAWSILITHGHQGDLRSDGNAWSQWLVAALWTPVQRYLDINLNTTAGSSEKIDLHNRLMKEWSDMQTNLLLITGHTHKPVFASGLKQGKEHASATASTRSASRGTYFNSGCCCYDNGDITGIEIDGDAIRLIQWSLLHSGSPRTVLEECPLSSIFQAASS